MDGHNDTTVEALLEHLIQHGPNDIATVFAQAFELAMQIERERFLGAGLYERTPGRQGYANGYKPKRIDTPAGTVTVGVPKTAGHAGAPFYPQSLERGQRSVRVACAASNMSSLTITLACGQRPGPSSAPLPGSGVSFIWPRMPSITRRTPRSANA